MAKQLTEEEIIMSAAWAQLAELGYGKDAKPRESHGADNLILLQQQNEIERSPHRSSLDKRALDHVVAIVSDDDEAMVDDDMANDDLRRRIKNFSKLKKDSSRTEANHALLAQIAAVHLSAGTDYRSSDFDANIHEAHSSFSSPGKLNFTIRERLSKMSRKERRHLLLKNASSQNSMGEDDDGEDYDDLMTVNTFDKKNRLASFDLDVEDSLTRLKRQANYGKRKECEMLQRDQSHHHQQQQLMQPQPQPLSPQPFQSKAISHQVNAKTESAPKKSTNRITLHVYDLFSNDTLMQLPWGCVCEIGKCFTEVNTALLSIGTGVYHVGVEVNGIEYAYGATSVGGKTGVFSCIPKTSPGYQYRTSISFGDVPLMRRSWVTVPVSSKENNVNGNVASPPSAKTGTAFRLIEEFLDGREVIKDMTNEYMGIDYDLLRKNCCTFAFDACTRLGVAENDIPTWFRNLAETGAMTQDVANAAIVQPLHKVLSSGCDMGSSGDDSLFDRPVSPIDCESGFEIVAKRNASNTKDVVVVIDAKPESVATKNRVNDSCVGFVRTPTWAY